MRPFVPNLARSAPRQAPHPHKVDRLLAFILHLLTPWTWFAQCPNQGRTVSTAQCAETGPPKKAATSKASTERHNVLSGRHNVPTRWHIVPRIAPGSLLMRWSDAGRTLQGHDHHASGQRRNSRLRSAATHSAPAAPRDVAKSGPRLTGPHPRREQSHPRVVKRAEDHLQVIRRERRAPNQLPSLHHRSPSEYPRQLKAPHSSAACQRVQSRVVAGRKKSFGRVEPGQSCNVA